MKEYKVIWLTEKQEVRRIDIQAENILQATVEAVTLTSFDNVVSIIQRLFEGYK